MKIIIDKGHTLSGMGTGAIGVVKETDKNREVGNRLIEMLKEHGHEVVDATVNTSSQNLVDRVKIANQHPNADIFVSLHLNAFNKTANGMETFILKGSSKAKSLAQSVQSEIVSAIGWANRGVKEAEYHVLKYTTMPAMLLELGFCDNQSDMDKWNTERIAMAIFKGLTGKIYTPKQKVLYTIQVGAYGNIDNAKAMMQKLKDAGFGGFIAEKML